MSNEPDSLKSKLASGILRIIDYPEVQEVRVAFIKALLELPKIPGIELGADNHGFMRALGVYRDGVHCYSLATAKHWIKVWLRAPELVQRPQSVKAFCSAFPDFERNGAGEYTARLRSVTDVERFLNVLLYVK